MPILILIICSNAAAKDISIIKKNNFSIVYSEEKDLYVVNHGTRRYVYLRRSYEHLLRKHNFEMTREELDAAKESMHKFNLLTKIAKPTAEDILEDAFQMRDQALSAVNQEITNPCSGRKIDMTPVPQYTFELSEDDLNPLNKYYRAVADERVINREDGFVSLRDFVDKFNLNKNQETGGLSLTIGEGSILQTHIEKVEGIGNRTQETVEIEGTKFEIRRGVNADDIYLRVVGKQGVSSESESYGALREVLDKNDIVLANDDKDDVSPRYAAEFNIGNRFNIFEDETNQVVSDLSVGRQVNIMGETEGYTRMRGDIRYRYIERDKNKNEVASVEARIYYDRQMYDERGETSPYGIEITRRYNISNRGNVFIEGGLHKKDLIEGGQINSREKPQWDTTLTIGVQYKF